jgi:O-antigen/teichoic acid export membrane protein
VNAEPSGTVTSGVRRGLRWKMYSQGYSQIARIAVAVLLARALSPHDYGEIGMAAVFVTLVLIFSDLAFGTALIQRPEITEKDRSTIFWLTTAVGALLTAAGYVAAPSIAGFYGEPGVTDIFRVLSLTFVITALGATHSALLTRAMDWRGLELRQIGAVTAGAVTAVVGVVAGWGLWAVVTQQVAIALASTLLLWACTGWRPRFCFSLTSLRQMAGFSVNVFGTRLLFYADRNVDNLLIGRFIGASALGLYAVAYNLMLVPLERIAGPLQQVFYPAVARLQAQPERMGRAWIRATRLIGAITTPAMLGVMVTAPDLVRVVLGSKWDGAVPVVQVLAWVGLHQSLARLNSSVLQAANRTELMLRYAIVTVIADVVAFGVGAHWGILGIAVAYAITTTLIAPLYFRLAASSVGLTAFGFLREMSGIMQASVLTGLAALGTREALLAAGAGPAARLVLVAAVGAIVAPVFVALRARSVLDDALRVLPERFVRSRPLRRLVPASAA